MPKILIVEDDANMVSFLTTILLGAGYACLTATSTEQARTLLDNDPAIGLMLLDQNLGEGSATGLAMLQDLRQSPKFQHIPVIICTGDSRTAVVAGFLGQRIADFIKKPFRPERLLADVQRVLGHAGNALGAAPQFIPR